MEIPLPVNHAFQSQNGALALQPDKGLQSGIDYLTLCSYPTQMHGFFD
jgi:hypothetical protein